MVYVYVIFCFCYSGREAPSRGFGSVLCLCVANNCVCVIMKYNTALPNYALLLSTNKIDGSESSSLAASTLNL